MCPPMLFKRCITPNLYKDEIKEIEIVLKKTCHRFSSILDKSHSSFRFQNVFAKTTLARGKGELRHSTVATQRGELGTF